MEAELMGNDLLESLRPTRLECRALKSCLLPFGRAVGDDLL